MLKKVLIGSAAILLLGVMALAWILVPPHLQIRAISPELPTRADLQTLTSDPNGPVNISYVITSSQTMPKRTLSHSSFIVEWADGRILLIDLGLDHAGAVEFGQLFETIEGADPATVHGAISEFLGSSVTRVEGVGFTHLHTDHVQGVTGLCEALPKAIIAVQTSDQLAKHNLHTYDSHKLLQNSDCIDRREITGNARQHNRFPGIGIYALGGHTPGSTLFAVPVGDTIWLLTGDIAGTYADIKKDRDKSLIYSYLMVPEDRQRLADLRNWLNELDEFPDVNVVVSHDASAIAESGMKKWSQRGTAD